jgi:hypothetical protein
MNQQAKIEQIEHPKLVKADPNSPVFKVTGRDSLVIKFGTSFDGFNFPEDRLVIMPADGLEAGVDYAVTVTDGIPAAFRVDAPPVSPSYIGGFHFAPGGNAIAREGGDDIPAINPFSLWDVNFRPLCPDPRGMVLVQAPSGQFWCDIYLTGADCASDGTSRFDVVIADGDDCPKDAAGKRYKRFDYETAVALMALHDKDLLSIDEFFAAAFGVKEKSACDDDPEKTRLDPPRTSKYGLMQATGNMWVWGHDGDPDTPRASFFGGSWLLDGNAGSRCAGVGDWPGASSGHLGARGRSDHLQPV